ncbi:MAG: hypothetical protein WC374_04840 [Phycisphaerae bacterium]|jgi:hypothetical protein
MKQKTERKAVLFQIIFLLSVLFQAKADIYDVNIVPQVPTFDEPMTIIVHGGEAHVFDIDGSSLQIAGTELQLNIFVTFETMLPGGTSWDWSQDIGTLETGIYELTVNEFGRGSITEEYISFDTFPLTFEVVPEPTTFAFILVGLPAVRAFLRRKAESL